MKQLHIMLDPPIPDNPKPPIGGTYGGNRVPDWYSNKIANPKRSDGVPVVIAEWVREQL